MSYGPVRLQLSRRRGFSLQSHSWATNGLPAANVAKPTKYGNPFKVGDTSPRTGLPMQARECVDWYERGLIAAAWAWTGGPFSIFHENQNELYAAWEARTPHLTAVGIELEIRRLRRRNLACWCALDQPCHADVLLRLANDMACEPA